MVKRTESLAIENIRRVAEKLREERNDAIAVSQVMREDLEKALALLREIANLPSGMTAEQRLLFRALDEKQR